MADIGSTLREARMRARIDISEVEASTKIRAKYLRAIENEEWDLLPGTVYVKSFLKTYGDYLGLDSRLLIDEFRRRYERPSDHDLRPIASLTRERERAARGPRGGLRVPRWLVIVVILLAVVVTLYEIGKQNPTKTTSPPPSNVATGTTKHHRGHPRTTPTTPTTTTPPKKTIPPPPTTARVQITPTSPVWICIENQANQALFTAATFTPGERVPVATGRILLVTLGNAGVDIKINGKHYPVSASNAAIGLKVTPTAVSTLPAGQEPTCG
jgi:cytoskeleton protein RodZ